MRMHEQLHLEGDGSTGVGTCRRAPKVTQETVVETVGGEGLF